MWGGCGLRLRVLFLFIILTLTLVPVREALACDEIIPGEYILSFSPQLTKLRSAQVQKRFQQKISSAGQFSYLPQLNQGILRSKQSASRKLEVQSIRKIFGAELLAIEPNCRLHAQLRPTPLLKVATKKKNKIDIWSPWGLQNIGQTGGKKGIDIDAIAAWQLMLKSVNAKKAYQVVVAVLDSGIDYTHPGLQGAIWRNTAEQLDGLDNDANGVIDDLHGFNAQRGDGEVYDENGHGTHVAGLVHLVANFKVGKKLIAPARVMSIKILGADGSGTLADMFWGMEYVLVMRARGVPIKVLNASFGGLGKCGQAERSAIEALRNMGILLVAAAGNEASNNDRYPTTPASCPGNNVISVAAVDHNGKVSKFSNYGKKSVDIASPGQRIVSYYPGGRLALISGTSQAAPFVSGVAAEFFSIKLRATPATARSVILRTAKKLPVPMKKLKNGKVQKLIPPLLKPGLPSAAAVVKAARK